MVSLGFATTTQAQEYTCQLMGWTATAPTGWELKTRSHPYSPMQNLDYFRNTDMSMGSAQNTRQTSPPPPPPAAPAADPKTYQGVTITKTDYNYIVIETHRITRKDVKNADNYNTEREQQLITQAKQYELYKNSGVAIESISDTERIDDKKFYTLLFNFNKQEQTKLRSYVYRWYNDKYELHASIVVSDEQQLQTMLQILEQTVKTIKNNEE